MIPRHAHEALLEIAAGYPIVALTGPRQSGKTTLARAAFPGHPYVSLDLLLERSGVLTAVEIKSGRTMTTDYIAGLQRWVSVAGTDAGELHLVFGGERSFDSEGVRVHTWREI